MNDQLLVFKNCQPYIKAVGNNPDDFPLLRGYKHGPSDFYKKTVRTDRKPSDTNRAVHNALNDLFYKKFKVKARSECLFVTGDFKFARGYGKIYSIFPVGNFKFYWNPKIEDLYADLPVEAYDIKVKDEELTKILEPVVEAYKSTNLKKAIKSGNEIMINCKEYYSMLYV